MNLNNRVKLKNILKETDIVLILILNLYFMLLSYDSDMVNIFKNYIKILYPKFNILHNNLVVKDN